jgi:hypothetical protein
MWSKAVQPFQHEIKPRAYETFALMLALQNSLQSKVHCPSTLVKTTH